MTNRENRALNKVLLVGTKLFTGAVLATRVIAPHLTVFLVWNIVLALTCGFAYKYRMDFR